MEILHLMAILVVIILLIVVGNKYMNENKFEIIHGEITITGEAGSDYEFGSLAIPYPTGYNMNNCVVVSVGFQSKTASNKPIVYIGLNDISSLIPGGIAKEIRLFEDRIALEANFDWGLQFSERKTHTYEYEIMLMKKPSISYTLGDVNGDGQITQADLDLITSYLNNDITFTERQFKSADVNQDGFINSGDTFKVQQYLNGVIDHF